MMYVSAAHAQVASNHAHHHRETSQLGAQMTAKLMSWDFHWSAIKSERRLYVANSELFHKTQALHDACLGLNMPLSIRSHCWVALITDVLTDFARFCFIGIHPGLCKYWPSDQDGDWPPLRHNMNILELAGMSFKHVICKHGVLDSITTHHNKEFTSWVWDRASFHLSIHHRLYLTFHLQEQGETECQRQTIE